MPRRKYTSGFPHFLWQEQHDENWKTFSYVEVSALNKAASKNKKRHTLPCSDPAKKATVYFDEMCSKNKMGDEKKIRCLIFSKKLYFIWTWNKNGGNCFVSFPPRMCFFLEAMFLKEVPKVNFYFKTEYEVDFSNRTIKDKNNGSLYNIEREKQDFVPAWNVNEYTKLVRHFFDSERLMEAVCTYSVDRIKNLLFDMPISGTEVSDSLTLPLLNKDLISTLKKQQKSSKVTLMSVDPWYTFCNKTEKCHVVSEQGSAFSATLIFTNLEENVNKFCVIQLLKFNSKKKFIVWSRHGRVGYDGNGEISEIFSNLKDAKKEFEDLFYEKTQNLWSERHSFQRKPMKYDYIHTFFNAENPEDILNVSLENMQSKLHKKIQELLLLIFCEKDLGLVVKKWLLQSVTAKVGIPTRKQLLQAFTALNEVANLLTQKNKGKELIEACNNYYMKMPHNTEYDTPKMIMTAEAFEDEVYMLQTLAYTSVNNLAASNSVESPVDLYFKQCQWSLTHLDHRSRKFKALHKSLVGLHGPTHNYKMDLLDAYQWHKQSELERYADHDNKMLLWHGTPLSNFLGILKHGLKLPPEEASSTSSMFGRALYFSDVSSKSANYCLPTKKNDTGLLLLCEVCIGQTFHVFYGGDYSTHPKLFGGLIAHGEYYPSSFTKTILAPKAVIAKGPLKRRYNKDLALNYNEYVLYNERQVKILYLLKVKFSGL